MRIAANNASLRKLRRLRLRAAVLTIDQLLEELELLNLHGRSRSLSTWRRRLFSSRFTRSRSNSSRRPITWGNSWLHWLT